MVGNTLWFCWTKKWVFHPKFINFPPSAKPCLRYKKKIPSPTQGSLLGTSEISLLIKKGLLLSGFMQQRTSATSRSSMAQRGWRAAHPTPGEKKHWRKNSLQSFTTGAKMGWGGGGRLVRGRLIIHDAPACQLAV